MTLTTAPTIEIEFGEERVVLRGDATIWLPDHRSLLVADLHLGKDASFRASGIPVPMGLNATTLQMIRQSIDATNPKEVLILGDLIHDRHSLNPELIEQFALFASSIPSIELSLVRGNHDRHAGSFPESWMLNVEKMRQLGSLTLVHETDGTDTASGFQIGGHWHPVVNIGHGADQMRLPCFVVSPTSITLPAFGPFKGGMKQRRKTGQAIYPICEGMVWQDRPIHGTSR